MNSNRVSEAIEIFKINVERYPSSGNVYDSLGEAYMRNGDAKEAIRHYKKSLEIDPGNTNARGMLESLENKRN
jgi:tetratricopeptide (TPR) repeat protein